MGFPKEIDSSQSSNEHSNIETSTHESGYVLQRGTWGPAPNDLNIETITNEAIKNPYIRDAIAIDIGTSKCKIAICKDNYIQIVEHGVSSS
ncbi:hypothetical protein WR25_11800 [Diploscapter pachys]|uniref:Uncharacterized protein n=1 Tax=Diploscapter pachys TaxID=2018661 RepID=A0A2A2LRE1_9BILA|nr:hypothetical protein WR25_11800 [Diploscapter pachys]